MSKIHQKPPYEKPVFKVGDRVVLSDIPGYVVATVIEDRGQLGVGGRRLYRIRFDADEYGNAAELELPAADLRPAPTSETTRR